MDLDRLAALINMLTHVLIINQYYATQFVRSFILKTYQKAICTDWRSSVRNAEKRTNGSSIELGPALVDLAPNGAVLSLCHWIVEVNDPTICLRHDVD